MIGTQNYCGYGIFRVIPDFEFQVGVPASARFVRGKASEYTNISRVSGQWIHSRVGVPVNVVVPAVCCTGGNDGRFCVFFQDSLC